jgi:CRP-like cAMP-binding protein
MIKSQFLKHLNYRTELTLKQIRGKIADVLLELSEKIYESDIFSVPLTQEDLGNLVDSSRESVSRVLTEF